MIETDSFIHVYISCIHYYARTLCRFNFNNKMERLRLPQVVHAQLDRHYCPGENQILLPVTPESPA
jgi:hypothetical protein